MESNAIQVDDVVEANAVVFQLTNADLCKCCVVKKISFEIEMIKVRVLLFGLRVGTLRLSYIG